MLKYQGSKSAYSGAIARIINRVASDLPFIDGCCGSGVMTEQMAKFDTIMIDKGAWGAFWQAMFRLNKSPAILQDVDDEVKVSLSPYYENWVRHIEQAPVPKEDGAFALSFLALQREAFNGKPIAIGPINWKTPGLGKQFSVEKFKQAWTRAKSTIRFVGAVVNGDITQFKTNVVANFYIDPDYTGTTGYHHSVDVGQVIRNNPFCNFFVSHHTELPGPWDEIIEVTDGNKVRVHTRSVKELVHVRKRL